MNDMVLDKLPDDVDELKALIRDLAHEQQQLLQQKDRELRALRLEYEKLIAEKLRDRAKRFAAHSEQGQYQYALFDEAERYATGDDGERLEEDTVTIPEHTKRKPRRKSIPEHLPRVEVHHDLSDAQKQCTCGHCMTKVGEEVSEQLDVIPAIVFVLRHIQAKYVCRHCDNAPITAPKSAQPIPGSIASPGLLAHVATSKYADGLPLYRQATMFKRIGVELSRQTLANHMLKAGELITPMINLLYDRLLDYDIVQMDETRTQVLKEPGRPAQSQSWMWVMKGGPPEQPVVLYHYDPSRSQAVPETLLCGYQGYLQTDGYAGYGSVTRQDDIRGLGCWTHVRRKYVEALNGLPRKEQHKGGRIRQALAYIDKLYRIETIHKDSTVEDRFAARQSGALPIIGQFRQWIDKQSLPPSTLLGKAIQYTINEWDRLLIYCNDGRLAIDNNGVENKIRPFAVGRKNWLFADSQQGAKASAALYSLIETARANQLNEYAYLKWLFTKLPAANSADDVEALLPWNVAHDDMMDMIQRPEISCQ